VKIPRDLSGDDLAAALRVFGYEVTRQTGSHLRLTTMAEGEHHITIPRHGALRIGTLASILAEVAIHFGMTRDQVLERLNR
jgi:predicted RNA binding protein YcfA (HicA-like mRNA interferase family)